MSERANAPHTSADVVMLLLCLLLNSNCDSTFYTLTYSLLHSQLANKMKECLCYQIRRNEVFTIYQHRFLLPNWHKMCSLPFRFHAFLRIWHSNFIPLSAARFVASKCERNRVLSSQWFSFHFISFYFARSFSFREGFSFFCCPFYLLPFFATFSFYLVS